TTEEEQAPSARAVPTTGSASVFNETERFCMAVILRLGRLRSVVPWGTLTSNAPRRKAEGREVLSASPAGSSAGCAAAASRVTRSLARPRWPSASSFAHGGAAAPLRDAPGPVPVAA